MRMPNPYASSGPIYTAFWLARILGWVSPVLGTLAAAAVWTLMPNSTPRAVFAAMILGMGVVYIGPGIVYLVLADSLKKYRAWAVTTLLAVASMHMLALSIGAIRFAMTQDMNPFSLFLGAWIVIMHLALIINLVRCYGAIRDESAYMARGFEPIVPARTPPDSRG
ncbi:MAG: hypothetical protein ACHRHE_05795 [Tepidisphaerales bacterium]